MSCYKIEFSRDGKVMRPVTSAEEYRALRNDERHVMKVASVRSGCAEMKRSLMEMNYSCIPGKDMKLKGCKTASNSVGMDIDFNPDDPDYDKRMAEVPSLVISKAVEVGLLMLERSVNKGYHVVFKRRFFDGLGEGKVLQNQEMNLRWASEVLGVKFDEGAKDINRVFFTTTASDGDLLYLSDELFLNEAAVQNAGSENKSEVATAPAKASKAQSDYPDNYQGLLYSDIIAKYWKIYNNGKEPCLGDRNSKTYELAKVLSSICNSDQTFLESVIPRYDGFSVDEWRKTIANAIPESTKEDRKSVV